MLVGSCATRNLWSSVEKFICNDDNDLENGYLG